MNLRKSFSKVFSVNILIMIVGIITTFLIPVFLDVEQYALFKTYGLLISFIGIFPFGFIDGMYVNYGGRRIDDINKSEFKYERKILFIFQLIIMVCLIIISISFNNRLLLLFSLTILPFSMLGFYKFFYQAVGNFTRYTYINISTVLLIFLFNVILVFIGVKNAEVYIILNVVAYYIVFAIVDLLFLNQYKKIRSTKNRQLIKRNFSVGIYMMFGNLSSILFYSVDRWFIKFYLNLNSFAYYSFAISMMSLIILFINSTSAVLYPYLASKNDDKLLKPIKNYLLILGSLVTLSYFIFEFIITGFIPKYVPSLSVISILFAGFPAIIVIRALYINLYTYQKKEKLYLKTVFYMLTLSILLNLIVILIFKNIIAISAATTISFYIWYFYSAYHFKTIKVRFTEIIYLSLFIISFIISANFLNVISGFLVCTILLCLLNILFYKNDLKKLLNNLLKSIFKYFK